MSTATRWTVGIAGLLFALSAFSPFTAFAHMWAAIVLGAVVGALGFIAARRTSWAGALVTLVGVSMLTSSFVGELQTGAGHFWWNLLAGLAVVTLVLFVREPAREPKAKHA